jgi:hypothetical protein
VKISILAGIVDTGMIYVLSTKFSSDGNLRCKNEE